ncbi:hypothetical protein [Cryptosporangium sp. NPDC051539]|uniref:hypothetical protein n=1 Tax=Cryptosporangium sp. NPDC051539 TaxID=3363962 RepID=UPI0037A20DF1
MFGDSFESLAEERRQFDRAARRTMRGRVFWLAAVPFSAVASGLTLVAALLHPDVPRWGVALVFGAVLAWSIRSLIRNFLSVRELNLAWQRFVFREAVAGGRGTSPRYPLPRPLRSELDYDEVVFDRSPAFWHELVEVSIYPIGQLAGTQYRLIFLNERTFAVTSIAYTDVTAVRLDRHRMTADLVLTVGGERQSFNGSLIFLRGIDGLIRDCQAVAPAAGVAASKGSNSADADEGRARHVETSS